MLSDGSQTLQYVRRAAEDFSPTLIQPAVPIQRFKYTDYLINAKSLCNYPNAEGTSSKPSYLMATYSLLRFAPLPNPLARPPPTVHLTLRPNPTIRLRPRVPPISASYTVPSTDRLLSIISYTLPFLNSLHYGRFILSRSSLAASLVSPILPVLSVYHSIPHAGFLAFFALYLAVARNPNLSRYARFNAMQAVVFDVMLALPVLVQRILGTPSGRVGFRVLEYGYGAVFIFAAVCFVYSVLCCVLGRTPYLPVVSSAADRQL